MDEWKIEIEGAVSSMQMLEAMLDGDVHIEIDGERGRLDYLRLTNITEPIDAFEIAKSLIDMINGSALLVRPDFRKVKIHSVNRIKEDGEEEKYGFLTSKMRSTQLHSSEREGVSIGNIFKAGSNNEKIADTVSLFGILDLTWRNLYIIYEQIKEDVGKMSKLSSKKEDNRFRWTANSWDILGPLGRHGVQSTEVPKEPMTLDEAQIFVRKILTNWIKNQCR